MIGDRNSKTRWICMFVVSPTLDWRSDASLSTCSQKDTSFSSAIPTSFSSKCVMQLDLLSSKVVSTPWEPLDLGISSPFPLNLEVVFCKISRYMLVPANSWRRRFNGGLFQDKLLRLDLLLGWGEKRKGGGLRGEPVEENTFQWDMLPTFQQEYGASAFWGWNMNYMKQKTLARIIKCPLSQSFVALSTCPSTFSVSFEDILVKKKRQAGQKVYSISTIKFS